MPFPQKISVKVVYVDKNVSLLFFINRRFRGKLNTGNDRIPNGLRAHLTP
jgi:hypothetical protein